MTEVLFGTKQAYKDWGLVLTEKNIGYPEPKTEVVDIPAADGVIDLSEVLTGKVQYGNRKIQLSFTFLRTPSQWSSTINSIAAWLHGKRLPIAIIPFESEYYWMGRCKINEFKTQKRIAQIVIDCDCDPYKLPISGSGEGVL